MPPGSSFFRCSGFVFALCLEDVVGAFLLRFEDWSQIARSIENEDANSLELRQLCNCPCNCLVHACTFFVCVLVRFVVLVVFAVDFRFFVFLVSTVTDVTISKIGIDT